ncbi:uncharacterized protein SOCEGT47_036900 [Sorangium cellulosum]|uniref:non-specific serine/threonine protein kinase n=1 Tax=Sorangium cellulosum TaxID=56 RepID=A0A4P2Q238_SORCE|nr:protein kinase [Sorangium cellulosum]AUX23171.1 uncharacterized protein SOCEGT47_036900 [Sorangium cellulosum]
MDCLRPSAPLDAGFPSSEQFLRGRLLGGRYLIEQMIGAGAMGRVYRARHVGLGRACAVKIIRERIASPPSGGAPPRESTTLRSAPSRRAGAPCRSAIGAGARARTGARSRSGSAPEGDAVLRFHIEALAASRLDHPNIVRVLDFGCEPADPRGADAGGSDAEAPSLWYLVTEHLDGEDLIDLLNAEPVLPAERILSIMRQLCSALQHAHDAGVIHRDVKPENIRLVPRRGDDGEPFEQVKLLDFGTARLLHDDLTGALSGARLLGVPDEDGAGLVIGTPAYMSPEQAAGQAVDARSDIYACGVLLFEMATGRLPFERPTPVALAAAHVECPPPWPSAFNEAIDPDLEALILQCLRKDPEDRPQSARALREALGHIAQRRARDGAAGHAPANLHRTLARSARAEPAPASRRARSTDGVTTGQAAYAASTPHASTWVGHRPSSRPAAGAPPERPCAPPPGAARPTSSASTWVGHRASSYPPAALAERALPCAPGGAPASAARPSASLAPAHPRRPLDVDEQPAPFMLLRARLSAGRRSQAGARRRHRRRFSPLVVGTIAATILGGTLCLLLGAAGAARAPCTAPPPAHAGAAPPAGASHGDAPGHGGPADTAGAPASERPAPVAIPSRLEADEEPSDGGD